MSTAHRQIPSVEALPRRPLHAERLCLRACASADGVHRRAGRRGVGGVRAPGTGVAALAREGGRMIQLLHGDSALVLPTLPNGSIDLTVTSPPYDNLRLYNGFTFDFETIARELYRVTKPGGVVVWVVGDATVNGSETLTSFRQAIFFHDIGFNVHDTMIYEQAGTGAKGSNLGYWQTFDYMFVLSKGTPKTVNRIKDRKNITIGMKRGGSVNIDGTPKKEEQHLTSEVGIRSNIWRYAVGFTDSSDNVDHPAVFPESLARDHILSWSNPGDTVLDPFVGSGTTGKMAVLNNRKFIGIDCSLAYLDIARKRIDKAQQQTRMAF